MKYCFSSSRWNEGIRIDCRQQHSKSAKTTKYLKRTEKHTIFVWGHNLFYFLGEHEAAATTPATTTANSSNSEKCSRSTRLHTAPAVERVLDGLARNSFYFIMFFVRPSLAVSVAHSLTLTRDYALHPNCQFSNFIYYFFYFIQCSHYKAAFGSKTIIFSWIRWPFVRTWTVTTVKSLFFLLLVLRCFGALAIPGDRFCADSVHFSAFYLLFEHFKQFWLFILSLENFSRPRHRPSTRFVHIVWHFYSGRSECRWTRRQTAHSTKSNCSFQQKKVMGNWIYLSVDSLCWPRIRDSKRTNGFVVGSRCDRSGEIA